MRTAAILAGGQASRYDGRDMPCVDAALVSRMFDWAQHADLVLPRTERGYHPLYAVYTRACLEPIARRLAARRLKLVELTDDVRTRVVTPEEFEGFGNRHRLLANVNTAADFAGLESLQGHKL
jgi:molybdopterin-guanine dinucleotide biosynthesis protein A